MNFKVLAKILPHPSIKTAVEVEMTKGGEPAGHGSVNLATLAESVESAKKLIKNHYPSISEDDIRVLV